jgi:AI-2 transport system permease protein
MKEGNALMLRISHLIRRREFRTLVFLVALFIAVGFVNPDFLSLTSIHDVLRNSVIYIVLVIGMTFVLLTGNIDISIAGVLGLSAAVSGVILRDGGSIMLAVAAAIAIGCLVGLVNALGVTKFKISSFIMTLGILGITRVIQVIYTKGKWVENIPENFKLISHLKILGVNLLLIIVIIVVALLHLYLSKNSRGRYFKAIGDNFDGAISLGIPVKRYVTYAFIISSVCASVAGLIFTSQVGFISTNAGNGIEMTVIAAAVLGGVSLSGGVGTVIGATIGAVILTSINSALVFMKVPAFWNDTISGTLLILIVVIDALLAKRAVRMATRIRLNARVLPGRAD